MSIVNIIIPAKNEEGAITSTLEVLKKKVKVPYRIIVVDDKSTDRTSEVVKNYQTKNKRVLLVDNKTKISSFGSALKLGVENVKSGFVVFVMADGCDDPETINLMYKKMMSRDMDVVCGSRYVKGGKKVGSDSRLKSLFSRIVNATLYLTGIIPTSDVSNAFKMYRVNVLKKVQIDRSAGVEVSMEILSQAYFNGAKVIDVPTVWISRKEGKSKFKMLKRFPKYLRIYTNIFFKRI